MKDVTHPDFDDKSTWGAGPWVNEPDRVEWRAHGMPCLLVRSPVTGSWCGYAGVSEGHPWFGRDYDDVPADAHGGLTYAGPCSGHICHVPQPGESDHVWWLGFDCGHWCDVQPRMEAMLSQMREHRYSMPGYEYRDQAYATAEVERLAQQAVAAAAVKP